MSFLHKLIPALRERNIQDAAATVAEHTRDQVWSLVSRQVVGMGQAEAYGYTRAKSRKLLALTSSIVIESHPNLDAWAEEAVTNASLDLICHAVWQLAIDAKRSYFEQRRAA